MSLPDKHRTARYESLNERLKAKAEAIIKKKFGLGEPYPSIEKMEADGWDKDAIEAVAFKQKETLPNGSTIYEQERAPKPITYIKLTEADYYIYYRFERMDYEIEAICPKCEEESFHYTTALDAERHAQNGFTWHCEDCEAQLNMVVSSKEFNEAYAFNRPKPQADPRSKFNIGDKVVVRNKGVLNHNISHGDMAEYIGNYQYRMINGACAGMIQMDAGGLSFEKFNPSFW